MTLEEFVFDLPLYQKIDEKNGYTDLIDKITSWNTKTSVDGYNPEKRCDSTFLIIQGIGDLREKSNGMYFSTHINHYDSILKETGVKTIILRCQRYGDKITIAVFHDFDNSIIMKVGQYPSVADIHIGQVKQYDKVLDKSILREFTKAIGLAANGVGIGSFVYLRRIFEKLVMDAYTEAVQDGKVDAEQFEKQRMDEKIMSLNGYLPSFIVENHEIYGILSKGIHQLTEEDCLAYFDCMRQSIELILDERLEQLAKKKKIEEVKKTLNSITSQIKK
ncbi:MAG: hypothetical protein IKS53_00105 [Bacteroidales bacterium]|nr:hypothetical protein [Bacteroidales bacterium]